jgi:hypothetical protein
MLGAELVQSLCGADFAAQARRNRDLAESLR